MILLIGYGNPLRRDDGLGPALVGRLVMRRPRPDLRPLICHQLTPELSLELAASEVKAVIFADASKLATPGGGATVSSLNEAPGYASAGHSCDPVSLLRLAERLYGRRPPAWLAALPGSDFGFGEGLSGAGRDVLAGAEEQVLELLGNIC